MLDQAVSYSLDRKQFNRAIGSFQAVKHMCAEMVSRSNLVEPLFGLLATLSMTRRMRRV